MKSLNTFITVVVPGHAATVFWHLQVLAGLQPTLTHSEALLFGALANLVPLTALPLWANFSQLAAWLQAFAVPLAIGGYQHSAQPGADNVFQMAPGPWTLLYRISAALLLILEILGIWWSVRTLRNSSSPALAS
jgi:hypothetical protein